MAMASYVQPNFLGGELSKFAQGRFDKPDYRVSLNVCFNGFPTEIGTWIRRPGTRFGGATRAGSPGRVIRFDFEQSNPYTMEFTDGFIRFRSGANIATTNDLQSADSVSTANPAVVETNQASGWLTGNSVQFSAPAPSPLLENRRFKITVVDTTHFSLQDEITGANIDGAILNASGPGIINRVQELASPYAGGAWAQMRAVQAETTAILLNSSIIPQAVSVASLPSSTTDAIFSIEDVTFLDGPYLDPVDGSTVSPSGTTGIINLTLGFQPYSAAHAYNKGEYASASGVGYKSLANENVGNAPASSPTFWQVVSFGDAIGPNGFVPTDIGRHIRLLNSSAGPAWSSATTYAEGDLVTNSSTGFVSLIGDNLNNTPSASSSFWDVQSPGWTWGKILAMSDVGLIDRTLGTIMGAADQAGPVSGGGLAASFDSVVGQDAAHSTAFIQSYNLQATSFPVTINSRAFVGKDYGASPKAILTAIYTPSTDLGIFKFAQTFGDGWGYFTPISVSLHASNTAPVTGNEGTVLATKSITISSNQTTPITLVSSDSVTTFRYVWITLRVDTTGYRAQLTMNFYFSQIEFYNSSAAPGTVVSVQLSGPPLPNTNLITTWRLGAYSDTTGYPTCGCYNEGRLWLGGAISNRFDASVSNGIDGSVINFAPTGPDGAVSDANAITEVLNSDSVNPILWMVPDLQGIIIGTQAGEVLLQAPTNGPMSPTNIAARRVTTIGGANVEPRRTDHTLVFAQRYSKKLMEYFADVYSGKFSAPNLADKAQHITSAGIAELAYQQAVTPIIWGRGSDGSLFGSTYKRDTLTTAQGPTFNGWHRHGLGSGRMVESICSGPSINGNLDSLTMVTNDDTTNVRHVEIITDALDELAPLDAACYLDSAVTPSTVVVSTTAVDGAPYGGATLNGLWHLNGKTVQVFAGGLDCGNRGDDPQNAASTFTDFLVTNGSCFVPFGDSISAGCGQGLFTADLINSGATIVVGFTYNSDGQLVRPVAMAETGARNGPAFGKLKRNHRYSIQIVNTKGLSIGTTFDNLQPCLFKLVDGETALAPLDMFSGIYQDTIEDDTTYDGMICWRVSRPYPVNVVAIGGNIETHDQ